MSLGKGCGSNIWSFCRINLKLRLAPISERNPTLGLRLLEAFRCVEPLQEIARRVCYRKPIKVICVKPAPKKGARVNIRQERQRPTV